jgi:hypothetical protein
MKQTDSHFIRNPEMVLYNPIWEYIAHEPKLQNIGVSDADMIVRVFDPKSHDHGNMFLFECKKQGALMQGHSQIQTYYILDMALKNLNIPTFKYKGFYLLRYIGDLIAVMVNNEKLTPDDFTRFLLGEIDIKPYNIKEQMERNNWL